MYFIPYNKDLKDFSRYLRTHSTLGEVLLWNQLKRNQIQGYTFYRQKPIDKYIVDFYCKPLNLVIEVDGDIHLEEAVRLRDEERQAVIEKLDLRFLRFEDVLVRRNIDVVLDDITKWIIKHADEANYTRIKKQELPRLTLLV
jgi:very-short-patch-repair endonuclease